jgi:hypothetical protein
MAAAPKVTAEKEKNLQTFSGVKRSLRQWQIYYIQRGKSFANITPPSNMARATHFLCGKKAVGFEY